MPDKRGMERAIGAGEGRGTPPTPVPTCYNNSTGIGLHDPYSGSKVL